MLVRLNWGTQYATQWGYHESRSVPMITAADAIALGADIVLVGMSIKTGSEAIDAENVEMVARCVAEKRAAGVPIVGEVYPAGHEDIAPEERHEVISIGCRIVAELGVDLVKTFHTGERFGEIVRSTPVPILALGAKKLPREIDALELAATAIRDGARGVVFGRNLDPGAQPGALPRCAAGRRQARRRSRRRPPPSTASPEPLAARRRTAGAAEAAMSLLIGLDIGTTSVKVGLFEAIRRRLASVGREYALDHPAPDRAEADATPTGPRRSRPLRDALQAPGCRPGRVGAIAVSSQGETVVAVDATGGRSVLPSSGSTTGRSTRRDELGPASAMRWSTNEPACRP